METALISPAKALYFGIPGLVFFISIPTVAVAIFAYIIVRRVVPLLKASPDPRVNRVSERIRGLLKLWLVQYRHPRYPLVGILHILLFSGFLILSLHIHTTH